MTPSIPLEATSHEQAKELLALLQSKCPPGRKGSKQTVTFASEITKFHFESMGRDEARQMWYSRGEYKAFRKDIKDCVRRRPTDANNGVFEPRGIEHLTSENGPNTTSLVVQCVLLAHKSGCDEEAVASIARQFSETFLARSVLLGILDYMEIYQPLGLANIKNGLQQILSSSGPQTPDVTDGQITEDTSRNKKRPAPVSDDEASVEDQPKVRQRTCS